jgi:single-strand DNA-binding protein
MPADINNVSLVARLTAKPELKGANSNVLPLRLAFTTREKQGEEWSDKSNYVDAVLYGRQAETMARFLDKGSRIAISGELGWQEWQAKDGSKRSRVQVVVRSIQLMDPKQQGSTSGESNARQIVNELKSEMGGTEVNDDDIPF